jgi:hypothetical protein
VARLLGESLVVLAREHPEAYARMCERLAKLTVVMEVDEERFLAQFFSRLVWVRGAAASERRDVTVQTQRRTIIDVLDNRQALTAAVLADAVRVIGPLEALLRLQEGLLLYVQGAVRCPGFIPLLRRLRGSGSPEA